MVDLVGLGVRDIDVAFLAKPTAPVVMLGPAYVTAYATGVLASFPLQPRRLGT